MNLEYYHIFAKIQLETGTLNRNEIQAICWLSLASLGFRYAEPRFMATGDKIAKSNKQM